jgi:hypothetical protein
MLKCLECLPLHVCNKSERVIQVPVRGGLYALVEFLKLSFELLFSSVSSLALGAVGLQAFLELLPLSRKRLRSVVEFLALPLCVLGALVRGLALLAVGP